MDSVEIPAEQIINTNQIEKFYEVGVVSQVEKCDWENQKIDLKRKIESAAHELQRVKRACSTVLEIIKEKDEEIEKYSNEIDKTKPKEQNKTKAISNESPKVSAH